VSPRERGNYSLFHFRLPGANENQSGCPTDEANCRRPPQPAHAGQALKSEQPLFACPVYCSA
jgi:hypothetical protein